MADFDVFLSYASADMAAAELLETWLQSPPRNRRVWRDRRGILPGAPDYYPSISNGIAASAAFLLLLSPRWLRSAVAARELSDAHEAGKRLVVVVHPAIVRDPATAEGRERKSELMQALQASDVAAVLERPNWIWLAADERAAPDFEPVERALATDFTWAARHAVIVQRLDNWNVLHDPGALLRGAELSELMADAFADVPGRQPELTAGQRAFLLESQRQEASDRERVEGLYWGAQARAVAFAARERGEAQPDLALLLAAEAVSVALVPEARAALLALLHRHAQLTAVLRGHEPGHSISGLAFSPDGRWLASTDRPSAIGDDRRAVLLIHDAVTGQEAERVASDAGFTAAAWGARWLAVASAGNIGWLRWDDWKDRFRGNTPAQLDNQVAPDYLAYSPPDADLPQGEVLAWGTQWGDVGLIRVGDHVRWQGRLSDDRSSAALTGLGWLGGGAIITAERGRLLARPFPKLAPAQEIAVTNQVYSLASDGNRWVACCRREGRVGLLLGEGTSEKVFLEANVPGVDATAAWAGKQDQPWLVTGSATSWSGMPAVALRLGAAVRETLLQGEDQIIVSLAADPTGRFVAAGERTGPFWLWDHDRSSHIVSQCLAGVDVRSIAASRTGLVAVATGDGRVLSFSAGFPTGPATEIPAPFRPERLLSADAGRLLLAIAGDGRIAVVGAGGAALQDDLSGVAPSGVIATATDAPMIAVLEQDQRIAVLRRSEGGWTPVCRIDAGAAVWALALDASGERLFAVVERLGWVLVSWTLNSPGDAPVELVHLRHGGIPPIPLACAHGDTVLVGDEKYVVLASGDGSRPAAWLGGHDDPVAHIAGGGNWTASSGCSFQHPEVDQVRLWSADGQLLAPVTLPEHIRDLVLTPEPCVIVLGHSGRMWRVTLRTEDLVAVARRIAGRGLTAGEEHRYGIDAWRTRPFAGLR